LTGQAIDVGAVIIERRVDDDELPGVVRGLAGDSAGFADPAPEMAIECHGVGRVRMVPPALAWVGRRLGAGRRLRGESRQQGSQEESAKPQAPLPAAGARRATIVDPPRP
jgi:hypothetical protein